MSEGRLGGLALAAVALAFAVVIGVECLGILGSRGAAEHPVRPVDIGYIFSRSG